MKIEGIPTHITHTHKHEVNIKVDPETMKAVRNITIIVGAVVLKYVIIKSVLKRIEK